MSSAYVIKPIEDFTPYPSITQTAPHSGLSNKYSFISTMDVIDRMNERDFLPTKIQEQHVRVPGKEGFQRHLVMFAHREHFDLVVDLKKPQTSIPLIYVKTDHIGATSFQTGLGFYRFICENRMMTGNEYAQHKLKHMGRGDDDFNRAVDDILNMGVTAQKRIDDYSTIEMTEVQQGVFAHEAAKVRFPEKDIVSANTMLQRRRPQDRGQDLWTVFNVVQENLLKGGEYINFKETGDKKVREINSIDRQIDVNRGLWDLLENTANLN